MTHQSIRRKLQGIATVLLLPSELWIIFSPVIVVFLGLFNVAVVSILIRAAIILWGLVVISSVFLQRAYCGHLCPVTGLFTLISRVTHSKDVMTMSYPKMMKYIVLGLWFLSIMIVTIFRKQVAIYRMTEVTIYYGLYCASALLTLTYGKSNTEHYICPFSPWMMAGIRLAEHFNIPSLRIVTDQAKCKKCKKCNSQCTMGYDMLRKVQENNFKQTECINCGECVEACKFGGITYKFK